MTFNIRDDSTIQCNYYEHLDIWVCIIFNYVRCKIVCTDEL